MFSFLRLCYNHTFISSSTRLMLYIPSINLHAKDTCIKISLYALHNQTNRLKSVSSLSLTLASIFSRRRYFLVASESISLLPHAVASTCADRLLSGGRCNEMARNIWWWSVYTGTEIQSHAVDIPGTWVDLPQIMVWRRRQIIVDHMLCNLLVCCFAKCFQLFGFHLSPGLSASHQ